MKQNYPLILIVAIVVVIGGIWFLAKDKVDLSNFFPTSPAPQQSQSATSPGEDQAIKEAFVAYFGKSADETGNVTVNKTAGGFAKGDFQFSDTGNGSFFAVKENSNWRILFTTPQGALLSCPSAEEYNFPKEVVSQCVNADGVIETLE